MIKRRQLHKESLDPKLIEEGEKPYWSTTSENGRHCYVNRAHPQRIRNGVVRQSFLDAN